MIEVRFLYKQKMLPGEVQLGTVLIEGQTIIGKGS